jgi:hypothetical protein
LIERLREEAVDLSIVVPDLSRLHVPRRQVRQVEQVVVQLPQHAVRHAVVVAVVALFGDIDERRATRGLDIDGATRCGDLVIAVGHRRGKPRRVRFEQHAGQGRHESA